MVVYENLTYLRYNIRSKRFGICDPNICDTEWNVRYGGPISLWLNQLHTSIEVECLSALQAKSVATTQESHEALSIRNAHVTVEQIRVNSIEIIDAVDNLIDLLPVAHEDLSSIKSNFQTINSKTYDIIELCRRKGCDYTSNKIKSVSILTLCDHISKFIDDFLVKNRVNNPQLEATLRKLKETFGEFVDFTIRRECEVITSSLNNKSSYLCLKWSLLAYWQLTQNDPYICKIFIESQNVTKRLIDIVTNYSSVSFNANEQIKAVAFKVLSFLCINQDAVIQIFNECTSGKSLITYISHLSNETVLREAIALMVQLTVPFIDYSKRYSKLNTDFGDLSIRLIINDLVETLTHTARSICSREIFLLICAAFANISFLDVDAFIKWETISVLVCAVRQRINFDDIMIKDQILTILANIARKYPLDIVSSGGLVFLLCAIQLRPSAAFRNRTDLVAIERIQQKSSVALARLGNHKSAAKLILKLNGVKRLIQLCKDAKERNFSDTVLLACLAALRRIAHTIGRSPFKELDSLDLINLEIRESFVLYSAKSESFV